MTSIIEEKKEENLENNIIHDEIDSGTIIAYHDSNNNLDQQQIINSNLIFTTSIPGYEIEESPLINIPNTFIATTTTRSYPETLVEKQDEENRKEEVQEDEEENTEEALKNLSNEISSEEQEIISKLHSNDAHWSTKLDCLQEIEDIITSNKISKIKGEKIFSEIKEALILMLSDLRSSIVKSSCDVIVSICNFLKEDFQSYGSTLIKPILKGNLSIIQSISSGCMEEILRQPNRIRKEDYLLFEDFLEDSINQNNRDVKIAAMKYIKILHHQNQEGGGFFDKVKIFRILSKIQKEEKDQIVLTAVEDVTKVLHLDSLEGDNGINKISPLVVESNTINAKEELISKEMENDTEEKEEETKQKEEVDNLSNNEKGEIREDSEIGYSGTIITNSSESNIEESPSISCSDDEFSFEDIGTKDSCDEFVGNNESELTATKILTYFAKNDISPSDSPVLMGHHSSDDKIELEELSIKEDINLILNNHTEKRSPSTPINTERTEIKNDSPKDIGKLFELSKGTPKSLSIENNKINSPTNRNQKKLSTPTNTKQKAPAFKTPEKMEKKVSPSNSKQKKESLSTNKKLDSLDVKYLYTEEDIQRAKQEGIQQALKEMAIVTADYDELEQKLNNEIRRRRELETFVQNYEKEFKNLALKSGDDKEKEGIKSQYTQLLIDYSKIESSFKELRSRYVELKLLNEKLIQKESLYKEKLQSSYKDLKLYENKYNLLKGHAEEQLSGANGKLKELSIAKATLEQTVIQLQQEITLIRTSSEDKDKEIFKLNDKLKKTKSVATNKTQLKALEDKIKNLETSNEKLTKENNELHKKLLESDEELKKNTSEKIKVEDRNEELQKSLHVFYEENQKLKAKIYDKSNEIEALKNIISSSSKTGGISSAILSDLEEKLKQEEDKRKQLELKLKAKEKENKELLDICNQLLVKIEDQKTSHSPQFN